MKTNSPALLVLIACCTAAGCSVAPPAEPSRRDRNQPRLVLLYMTCTLNKSFLSPYNSSVSYTPHIDQFSRGGVVFTKHRTEAGLSGVAFASIYTGCQAVRHGVFTHPTRLADSNYDISEAFAKEGYEVFLWDAHPMASYDLNYAQAAHEENVFKGSPLAGGDRRLAAVLDRLAADEDYKALLVTSFTVTHSPYSTDHLDEFRSAYPEECRILEQLTEEEIQKHVDFYRRHRTPLQYDFPNARRRLNLKEDDVAELAQLLEVLYKSNVNYLDRLFGSLLRELESRDVLDEALVVFAADHGESLFEERGPFNWSHGHTLQADTLEPPLIIRADFAGLTAGQFDHVTRSIDVFPTVTGLARLRSDTAEATTGVDLSATMTGEAQPPRLAAYSHSSMLPPAVAQGEIGEFRRSLYPQPHMALTWTAVRVGDMVWKQKKRNDGRFEFAAYNLRNDPAEFDDVFDPDDARDREMVARLKGYKAELVKSWHEWTGRRDDGTALSKHDSLRRLRSLGYIQ